MRRFSWLAAGAAVLFGLVLANSGGVGVAPAADPPPLSDMTEITAHNGLLAATLEVRQGTTVFDGVSVDTYGYNGSFSGPVLRVWPGDTMRIRLANRLSEPTNLHFHGMQGSPLGNGDNVHISVPAGADFDYEIKIPAHQPPGAYWYHAHEHGVAERQVGHGLSGALMIEGFTALIPGLEHVRERLLAFRSVEIEDSDDPLVNDQWHGVVQTVNDRTSITETAQPGEAVVWHLTNHDADETVHLALEGHRFTVIGRDGAAIPHAYQADVLDIAPAARLEVLVTAGQPGEYTLSMRNVLTGKGADLRQDRIVGHFVVSGSPATPVRYKLPDMADLSGLSVNGYRRFVYTQSKDSQKYYINGRLFDAGRTDTRVNLGDIEDWTIRNDTDDMHTFHIHQLAFQVMSVNGQPAPFNGLLDTVVVPVRGELTIRLAFTRPEIVGSFMYHCHVLRHEDRGMMQVIEVVDPKATTHASNAKRGVASWLQKVLAPNSPPLEHLPICSALAAG
jgi:FtsP/CotA-like multicopper oxidase with cupredoxin domain